MSSALQSGHWFRVAPLRPRLHGHLRTHRHSYRNKTWYIIEDRASGQHHRFNPAAFDIIQRFDGTRTMQDIWDDLLATLRDNTPSQTDLIDLLGQLYAANLLAVDVTPDAAELFERRDKRQRQRLMNRFLNPMSLRFPLWDPDRFLTRLERMTRRLDSRLGAALWCAVVLPALFMAPTHWNELTQNFTERWLGAGNLLVAALVFPILKFAHETAHGWTVKRSGGGVHEMGVMLLMLYPVPYVDASSASSFVRKWERLRVSAAGMLAEIWLAAVAFYLWLLLEPGLMRSIAYNVLVLGSVSSVLFNANPLLRFDGYYFFSDLIEVPNLGQRASAYWQYLFTKYVFGVSTASSSPATVGERRWFLVYGPLALGYRIWITLWIAWFLAQSYFFVGVVLAIWGLAAGAVWPIYKGLAALFTRPHFLVRSARVHGVLIGGAVALGVLLFLIPAPYHTRTQGVLDLPENALVRAGTSGFVSRVNFGNGAQVAEGDVLIETYNLELSARLDEQTGRVAEAKAKLDSVWGVNPTETGRLGDELNREQALLDRLIDEVTHLRVRARAPGKVQIDLAADLPGRFVHKGEVLGYLVRPDTPIIRAVVRQEDIDQVLRGSGKIEVRLLQEPSTAWYGSLIRSVPQAVQDLRSAALGQEGGGSLPVDPRDEKHVRALESVFEFDIAMPLHTPAHYLGSRVLVSFEHPDEPIGWRWLRHARRLFLSSLET